MSIFICCLTVAKKKQFDVYVFVRRSHLLNTTISRYLGTIFVFGSCFRRGSAPQKKGLHKSPNSSFLEQPQNRERLRDSFSIKRTDSMPWTVQIWLIQMFLPFTSWLQALLNLYKNSFLGFYQILLFPAKCLRTIVSFVLIAFTGFPMHISLKQNTFVGLLILVPCIKTNKLEIWLNIWIQSSRPVVYNDEIDREVNDLRSMSFKRGATQQASANMTCHYAPKKTGGTFEHA